MNLPEAILTVLLAIAFAKLLVWQRRYVRQQDMKAEEVVRKKQQEQQQPKYTKITLSNYRNLTYEQRLEHVDSICGRWLDFKAMSAATRMRAIESDPLYWLPENVAKEQFTHANSTT